MNNSHSDRIVDFLFVQKDAQKEHFILWWPIFLGIGVAIYFSLKVEPSLVFVGLAMIISGAITVYLRIKKNWMFVPCLLIGLTLLGLSAGAWRSHSVSAPFIKKEMRFATVEGKVERVEERDKGAKRLLLTELVIEDLSKDKTPKIIQLTIRKKDVDISVGQRISVLASLRPPSPPVMPYGFDFQRFFYFKSIGATGFAFSNPKIIDEADISYQSPVERYLYGVSEDMKAAVKTVESKGNPIVQALLTGDRASIKESSWDHLRDSGLSHMLAISGLHVGLFSATVFFFVRIFLSFIPSFPLRFQTKKVAAVVAFCAALFYTLLVGASVPTVRACVMTGMFFLAILMDRSPFSVHLLAFAAFVILLFRPESLMSASFQMSFAAVMGLIIFYSSTRAFWIRQYANSNMVRKLGLYLLSISATTVIATIVTTPFTLYHFQHIAVYGVLGNLLAVPVMAFIVMPMAVFSFFLLPFGLAEYPLMIMRLGVEKIMEISSFVSLLDGASFSMPTMPFTAFCLAVIGGLSFLTIRGKLKSVALIPIIVSITLIIVARPADILISENGKLWGVYQNHELYVSNTRKGKFTRKQWNAYLGLHEDNPHKIPKSGCVDNICCDNGGCHVDIGNQSVSFLTEKYGINASCDTSDLVIAPFSIRSAQCPSKKSIDWYNFKQDGARIVWVNDDGYSIQTVEGRRGDRPWIHQFSNGE